MEIQRKERYVDISGLQDEELSVDISGLQGGEEWEKIPKGWLEDSTISRAEAPQGNVYDYPKGSGSEEYVDLKKWAEEWEQIPDLGPVPREVVDSWEEGRREQIKKAESALHRDDNQIVKCVQELIDVLKQENPDKNEIVRLFTKFNNLFPVLFEVNSVFKNYLKESDREVSATISSHYLCGSLRYVEDYLKGILGIRVIVPDLPIDSVDHVMPTPIDFEERTVDLSIKVKKNDFDVDSVDIKLIKTDKLALFILYCNRTFNMLDKTKNADTWKEIYRRATEEWIGRQDEVLKNFRQKDYNWLQFGFNDKPISLETIAYSVPSKGGSGRVSEQLMKTLGASPAFAPLCDYYSKMDNFVRSIGEYNLSTGNFIPAKKFLLQLESIGDRNKNLYAALARCELGWFDGFQTRVVTKEWPIAGKKDRSQTLLQLSRYKIDLLGGTNQEWIDIKREVDACIAEMKSVQAMRFPHQKEILTPTSFTELVLPELEKLRDSIQRKMGK